MFVPFIDFASLLVAALLVGTMFGVRLFLNPAGLDFGSYVVVQKQAIRTLNSFLPALGGATIILTATSAALSRHDRTRLFLLIFGIAFFVVSGLVTRFCNQPINAIVIAWRSDAPPTGWTALRDSWWRWHQVRLASGLISLASLIVAALKRS
jgi:uncharacterized membrane protein